MATPSPHDYGTPRAIDAGVARDVIAAILLIGGFVGLVVTGFFVDWRLGAALLSLGAMTGGAFMSYRR